MSDVFVARKGGALVLEEGNYGGAFNQWVTRNRVGTIDRSERSRLRVLNLVGGEVDLDQRK